MSKTESDNLLALFKDRENIDNIKLGVSLIKTDINLYEGDIKLYTNSLFRKLLAYDDYLKNSIDPYYLLLSINTCRKSILYLLRLKYEYIRSNQIN